jgi:hypothetical protein
MRKSQNSSNSIVPFPFASNFFSKAVTYFLSQEICNLASMLVSSSIVKLPDWFESKSLKICLNTYSSEL